MLCQLAGQTGFEPAGSTTGCTRPIWMTSYFSGLPCVIIHRGTLRTLHEVLAVNSCVRFACRRTGRPA